MNRRGFFASLLAPLIARCTPLLPKIPIQRERMWRFPPERSMPVIYGRRCYSFTVPAATWEGLFPGGANPETLWFTANGEGGLCRVDSITRNETEVSVSLTQVPTLAEAFDCPDYPAAPPHLHGGFLESLRERDAIAFDLD